MSLRGVVTLVWQIGSQAVLHGRHGEKSLEGSEYQWGGLASSVCG